MRFRIINRVIKRYMNKRTIESTAKVVSSKSKIISDLTSKLTQEQINSRSELFEQFLTQNLEIVAKLEHKDIEITLPDTKVVAGKAYETTPLDIALGISKNLAKKVVAARIEYLENVSSPFGQVIDCDEAHEEGMEESEASEDEEDIFKDKVGKKTNYIIQDLTQPLLGNCKLELITFDDPKGKEVFWHSSAHILGYSLEQNFGAFLTHGPPLDSGFFYDSFTGKLKLTPKDYQKIEDKAKEIVQAKEPFQKIFINKDQALELFKDNPFKVSLIQNKIKEGTTTSAYKCGNLVDLCTGPHLPDTGRVKAFKITKNSAAYWLGNQENDSLQRVYSITFPQEKDLKKWSKRQAEIIKKDHRTIGEQQKLFFFSNESPGCAFFLKHGTRIFNRLQNLMKKEYFFRGFDEVNTPTMYKNSMWKTSGHFYKYQKDMFFLKAEEEEFALKPMNCPSHCLIFNSELKSYRDLPIRMADFGVLHRNEDSGALTGLTRVRKFHQDDSHIFCRKDQIEEEIIGQLSFIRYVYGLLGLNYSFELSTRPKNFVGDKKLWRDAELQLKNVLDKVYPEWTLRKGDGAFYGPKIDIKVTDTYNRMHQLATIQLDFNLPVRFNLQYKEKEAEKTTEMKISTEGELVSKQEVKEVAKKVKEPEQVQEIDEMKGQEKYGEEGFKIGGKLKTGFSRPIIIHRAILGSLERCIAILCEHFGGKWPFWLSPRQIAIVPVSDKYLDYANKVEKQLSLHNYYVKVITLNATLNKKVRVAQMAQYNYILVVGEKEAETGTVNVRVRDTKKPKGIYSMGKLLEELKQLEPCKSDAQNGYENQANSYNLETKEANFLKDIESQLTIKMFLDNEGLAKGDQDMQALEKLKLMTYDSYKFPNIKRWMNYMDKTA